MGKSCSAPDEQLAALGHRQHNLVTLAQLHASGLTDSAVSKRVSRARLFRVRPGVYSLGPVFSRESRWMAATLWSGGVLSHTSAALAFGIVRSAPSPIHVTVTAGRRVARDVVVHQVRGLDSRDVTVWNDVRVTTVPRTIVDLAGSLRATELANVMHEAAYRDRMSVRLVRAAAERVRGRSLATLREALEMHITGSAGTRSQLEVRALRLARGLPRPQVNVEPVPGIEVDLLWADERVCVEIDGPGHDRPRARKADRARDAVLTANGFTVLRFSEVQVDHEPRAVSGALRSALSQGSSRT